MDQVLDCDFLPVVAVGVHPKNTLMMLDIASGKHVVYDGVAANDHLISGHLTRPTVNAGDNVEATLRVPHGLSVGLSDAAITLGQKVHAAPAGKMSSAVTTGKYMGMAWEAVGAGEYFRYRPSF